MMKKNRALIDWYRKHGNKVCAMVLGLSLVGGVGQLHAQEVNLSADISSLIAETEITKSQIEQYLQQQGDYHLLYVIDAKPMDRLVVAERQLIITQLQFQDFLARARQAATSNVQLANQLQSQAITKFQSVIQQYERLIDRFKNSPRLPIWQTNLAEFYLQQQLQLVNSFAAEAYCFGVASKQQEDAYSESVQKAFILLANADRTLYKLQTTLPRSKNYSELNTQGLPALLFDEYNAKRTPYYLAVAAIYVATLPDNDPYFASDYDKTNATTIRAETPEKERVRLLNLALGKLEPYVTDQGDLAGIRFPAILHASHALLLQEQYDAVIKLLQPLQSSTRQDLTVFTSYLLRAHAVAMNADVSIASGELRQLLTQHPFPKQSLALRMLVTDVMFRVQEKKSRQYEKHERDKAINTAFEAYYDLLNDKSLSESDQKQIRYFIAQRFERLMELVPNIDALPAEVRITISDYALQHAQQIVATGADPKVNKELARYLNMVSELATSLDELNVDRGIRARSLYNAAVAIYLPDPDTLEVQQQIANKLTDVARKYPQQPVSLKAITFASQRLQLLHQQYPKLDRMIADYSAAAEVLFRNFSVSPAADNQRVYYAFHLLQTHGKYEQAASHYKLVPFDHVQYFDAQRELLFCLDAQIEEADEESQTALIRELDVHAKRILREVDTELNQAQSTQRQADRIDKAKLAQATAHLLFAVNAERQGKHGTALEMIDQTVDFNEFPQLMPRVLQVRIGALIGENRFADAAELANTFMQSNPSIAAPTIERLLLELDAEFKQILKFFSDAKASATLKQKSKAVLTLVQAMKNANQQGHIKPTLDESYFVSLDMIAARACMITDDPAKAISILETRLDQYGDILELIVLYAEANFILDTKESYKKSRDSYQLVISAYPSKPYPAIYYQAWLRYLQTCDRLQTEIEDIPLYINRLRMHDQDLGGENFTEAFNALEDKYNN
ncbi:hypothetical protein JD969_15705 [Planctomycetota bacterium]|nr:hypothetical protein JD969_15705 [Planctomycetota bacterium]